MTSWDMVLRSDDLAYAAMCLAIHVDTIFFIQVATGRIEDS
jgi:hypothetical protein